MIKKETEIVVPFHDVDYMGVVWHGRYVKYLEVARDELMSLIDYSTPQMIESGYAWPVVDMRIKYVRPLLLNQKINVLAEITEWEYRLKINYLIRDASTLEPLTKAHTIQVALDIATREMCYETPEMLKEKSGSLRHEQA